MTKDKRLSANSFRCSDDEKLLRAVLESKGLTHVEAELTYLRWAGLTNRQITDQRKTTEQNTNNILHSARKKLRKMDEFKLCKDCRRRHGCYSFGKGADQKAEVCDRYKEA